MQHQSSSYTLLSLAVLLASCPVYATEEVVLFPAQTASRAMSSGTPQQLPALQSPEEVNGGPLRVVIPNIRKEQKKTVETSSPPATMPTGLAPEALTAQQPDIVAPPPVQIVPIKPAVSAANPQPPAPAAPAPTFVSTPLPPSFIANAKNTWDNAVLIPNWQNIPIVVALFRPALDFSILPTEWAMDVPSNQPIQMAADESVSLGALQPAAGEPERPLLQTSTPVVADSSEPPPALSEQSKAIAKNIPQVSDQTAPKEEARNVSISRAKEKTNGLGAGEVVVSKQDAMGMKIAKKRAKTDPSYELERAYNALLAGKSDDAIQIYEDVLTGDPKNKEALFGLASTYHRAGQIDVARSLYGKLLEIDPKNRDGLNNFLVLLADEAPQEALSQMEQLEAQNPDFSPIPAQMAIIYQKLGEKVKAVDKMYRALAIAPENVTYRYNLAIMLDKDGQYDQAGTLYAQILDSHAKGETIPGDASKIQQRLTFIRSNGSNR